MCQATVYVLEDGARKEVLREVTRLVPVEGGVRLERFFEEPYTIAGQIVEIDFLKHTIYIAPTQESGKE
jgi:predicted RNA-binding protein